jgi:hypothetical protein
VTIIGVSSKNGRNFMARNLKPEMSPSLEIGLSTAAEFTGGVARVRTQAPLWVSMPLHLRLRQRQAEQAARHKAANRAADAQTLPPAVPAARPVRREPQPIDLRPVEADGRQLIGDWKGDLIILRGSRSDRAAGRGEGVPAVNRQPAA